MKRILLIDDIRTLRMVCGKDNPDEFRKLATTFEAGIEALDKEGPWDVLYLDHDLGLGRNGSDIMVWLAEHIDKLPKDVYFVTANPDGLKRMAGILEDIKEGVIEVGFRTMGSQTNALEQVAQIYDEEDTVSDATRWAARSYVDTNRLINAFKESEMKDETMIKKLKYLKENKWDTLTSSEKSFVEAGIDTLESGGTLSSKVKETLRVLIIDKE